MRQIDYAELARSTGYTTDELAIKLGIGRATMFRRMKPKARITPEMHLAIHSIPKKCTTKARKANLLTDIDKAIEQFRAFDEARMQTNMQRRAES